MNAKSSPSRENSCHILMVRAEHGIKISCLLPSLEAFEHHDEKAHSVSVANPACTPENSAGPLRALFCGSLNCGQCRLALPWVASKLGITSWHFSKTFAVLVEPDLCSKEFLSCCMPPPPTTAAVFEMSLPVLCDIWRWSPRACRVKWEEFWSHARVCVDQDSDVHRRDGSQAVRRSSGRQTRRWEASGNVFW